MSSFLYYTLIGLGVLVLLLGAAYGYFAYSPAPDVPTLSASVQERTLQAGGRTRTYLAYVPAKLPPNPALVLVLHGSNSDGAAIRRWTGYEFDEMADRHGFIVLYPNGYKQNWNDCRTNTTFPAKKENIDDMGFMRALVEQFRNIHGVDRSNVYAFGYSNGGQMAFRMAIEEPRLVAAVTAVGANLPTPDNFACGGQGSTARVMLVSGTADPIMPYKGGVVTLFGFASRGAVLSARATAGYFAERNGLTQRPVSQTIESTTGTNALPVERLTWSSATRPSATRPDTAQLMVAWYTVTGGGHVVPQPRFRFPRLNGPTAINLDTPAQAVAFFGLTHELLSGMFVFE